MRHYKAIICDLDGTTIPNRHDGMPSPAVVQAIARAKEQLHVVAATARPYFFAEPVIRALHLTGPSIFHGGARIIDVTDKRILWEQTMGTTDIFEVCEILKQSDARVVINDDGKDIPYTTRYMPYKPLTVYVHNLQPVLAKKLRKQLKTIPTVEAHLFAGYIPNTLGVVASHVTATKQHAIVELAKILTIETNEMIGVGDSHSDFPLLMACGAKVAMDNAVDDLKAIADYIAPCVEHDGVAHLIDTLVFKQKPLVIPGFKHH